MARRDTHSLTKEQSLTRRLKVVELRDKHGMDFSDIATRLGFSGRAQAGAAYHQTKKELEKK
jgi:DNA-binding transcriptional regulator YiaG